MKTLLENLLLAAVGIAARMGFILYRLMIIAVVLGVPLGLIGYGFYTQPSLRALWWVPLALVTLGVWFATRKPAPPKDNPYRKYTGFKGWIDARIDAFIAWIGTIKYFTSPLCLVEDPGAYKIKGFEIRALIDGALQPGDILLRGYDGYLDGEMIRLSGDAKGRGAYFSHAALYLGELSEADKPIVARRLQVQGEAGQWLPATEAEKTAVRNDPRYFQTGRQMVVHAMTRGVHVEDILTFLRCDYLIVMRLHETFRLDPGAHAEDASLIKELAPDAESIHGALMRGENVSRAVVIEAARRSALGKIGSCYDFQFNDIKTAHRFSCSEFVYYCYKSVHCYLGLHPKMRGFLNFFFRRETITPSDIYDAAHAQGKLETIWVSGSLEAKQ